MLQVLAILLLRFAVPNRTLFLEMEIENRSHEMRAQMSLKVAQQDEPLQFYQ